MFVLSVFERIGGYEKAKDVVKKAPDGCLIYSLTGDFYVSCMRTGIFHSNEFLIEELKTAIFEYEREQGIQN